MAAHFTAELTDGRSATVRWMALVIEADGVRFHPAASAEGAEEQQLWPLAGLQVEKLGQGLVHLHHPSAPGATLSSRDPGLVEALGALGVRLARRTYSPGELARLGAAYGASLVLLVGLVYLLVPPLSRLLAHEVPLSLEARLGAQAEAFFEGAMCRGGGAPAVLSELRRRLLVSELDGPRPGDVEVLNWEMVNAFTLPGGKVLLTRGLLDKAEGPDEIAGVLAHEFEHVRQRHVMSALIRGSIFSFGWAVTVGDFSGLLVVDPATLSALVTQGFSRGDERAADQFALMRLQKAGISRQGLAAFFRRMQAESDLIPAWLGSHPSSKERLETIEGSPGASQTTPALSAPQWAALKAVCDGQEPIRDPLRALLRGR